ncbi:MAG TPA: response regulator [Planctomycetota bacterium]|nr:response regulator [Planctomycetota bacterium]
MPEGSVLQTLLPSALLIEEDFIHGGLIKSELAVAGIDVRMAVTELEASDMLGSMNPDLIICDWDTPGIDGRELLGCLKRKAAELSNIPVILMTTRKVDATLRSELMREGFRWILRKPLVLSVLPGACKRAMSECRNTKSRRVSTRPILMPAPAQPATFTP